MKNNRERRFVLCNDGESLSGPADDAPMTKEKFIEVTLGPLKNTQIDTFYWQLGTDTYHGSATHRYSDVYSHDTSAAPMWGEDMEAFGSSTDWRIYENTRSLIEQGNDPPKVLIEAGKDMGLEVFISTRFNDNHDGLTDVKQPYSSKKRDNPDWLLGPTSNPSKIERLKSFTRFAYNFALPEVREYKMELVYESIEKYDLDGWDWDFCRTVRFFPEGTEEKNIDLITEMMRLVRSKLDEKGKRINRKLALSVRVPPIIDMCRNLGLDVKTWIDEGLVDIVVAGVTHGNMHRVPVEDLIESAKNTQTEVLVQNPGLFFFTRPYSSEILFNEPNVFTDEMCRASAATYWQAGIDGIYLWNNHLIEWAANTNYDRTPWKEVADPNKISKLNKHYLLDYDWQSEEFNTELSGPTVPKAPLPAKLDKAGDSINLKMDIADDPTDDSIKSVVFRILINNLTSLDTLDYKINGTKIDHTKKHINYNHYWIDFELDRRVLVKGFNSIDINTIKRNKMVNNSLTIESVELFVNY